MAQAANIWQELATAESLTGTDTNVAEAILLSFSFSSFCVKRNYVPVIAKQIWDIIIFYVVSCPEIKLHLGKIQNKFWFFHTFTLTLHPNKK
jgi:hypothetical protein